MAATRYNPPELRRQVGSPRPKTRDSRDTMCRNVMIYGHCRYEDTCAFNHEVTKPPGSDVSSKKSLNVESPSFTPAMLQQQSQSGKKATFSSQAAGAAFFTPKSSTPLPPEPEQSSFNVAAIREFTPQVQSHDQSSSNGVSADSGNPYEHFNMDSVAHNLPAAQFNPYANDQGNLAGQGVSYFSGQPGYTEPLQQPNYHQYFPIGPRYEELPAYFRSTHDFFVPDKLREDVQRKSFAALNVMPNPIQLEHYHSLNTLDTSTRRNGGILGYVSWVYKAVSSKNGNNYCLRRLEGYRLTTENAMRSVKEWKKIDNANIVRVQDAFTTRGFGDSSLVFAIDYFPLAKTLAEHHFPGSHIPRSRNHNVPREDELWAYICQIANALRSIHGAKLAARCIDLTKVILTDKHQIRLSGCGVLDVIQYDMARPLQDLQQQDFVDFGRMMLCLGTSTLPNQLNQPQALKQLESMFPEMSQVVGWLLSPADTAKPKSTDQLISGLAHKITHFWDTSMHAKDSLVTTLSGEIENGRLVRLLMKLATVTERGYVNGDTRWDEHGERYQLKLFRDYVFHQVDAAGNAVVNMGHMLGCLNRLDAGVPETVRLTSRDGQSDFVISYKELNKMINAAFGELTKAMRQNGAGGV